MISETWWRPDWDEVYKGVAHKPDRDGELVPVTRETLRLSEVALNSLQSEEAYHHRGCALHEIAMALSAPDTGGLERLRAAIAEAMRIYHDADKGNEDSVETAMFMTLHKATIRATLVPDQGEPRFLIGQRVTKIKGAHWTGKVVGTYRSTLTPIGYAVESENEVGNVQVYPEQALRLLPEGSPFA